MPDVTRSDSQRSDSSLRPRVSFNRDVHVKRIVPRGEAAAASPRGAVINGGGQLFVLTPPPRVRKERPRGTKKQLAEEAAQVVQQAERHHCVSKPRNQSPEKFYTLPSRKSTTNKRPNNISNNNHTVSLDRKSTRKKNSTTSSSPPQKPQRTFAHPKNNSKPSVFDLFVAKNNNNETRKSKAVRRTLSDATNLKSKSFNKLDIEKAGAPSDDHNSNVAAKKQLSPIIEVVTPNETHEQPPRYHSNHDNKENDRHGAEAGDSNRSATQQLRDLIDEVDHELNKNRDLTPPPQSKVVIIDLDKAITTSSSGKKSIKHRFNKALDKMIHSSQQPQQKPPLTKGRAVDKMVQILNSDPKSQSPPPRSTVVTLTTPSAALQHNSNQPFSYTRGLSPDKLTGGDPIHKPVIYAQVVCNGGGQPKQTIHTTHHKKYNSDSDEGLGLGNDVEFRKNVTHFGDEVRTTDESPIMPRYRVYSPTERIFAVRGRGDGMDSIMKPTENAGGPTKNLISARRDLLESRINRRIVGNNNRSPEYNGRSRSSSPALITTKKYYQDDSFASGDSRSSPDHNYNNNNNKLKKRQPLNSLHKSTPNIYHLSSGNGGDVPPYTSYHGSLKRDSGRKVSTSDKDRFDSGIETDGLMAPQGGGGVGRGAGGTNGQIIRNGRDYDSEDEGFASSFLISSERNGHHENEGSRDLSAGEDYDYSPTGKIGTVKREYGRREEKGGVVDKKPPKPERKSGLDKVRQLFTRDSNKKNKRTKQQELVREESLRARYTEYRGSRDNLLLGHGNNKERRTTENKAEVVRDYDISTRRRLSTPSPERATSHHQATTTTPKSDNSSSSSYKNWFKSLDRLSRKKPKKEDPPVQSPPSRKTRGSNKNLRFFGDTDADSSDSAAHHQRPKAPPRASRISQSTRELHNIFEDEQQHHQTSTPIIKKHHAKSMVNISAVENRSGGSLKPPMSPSSSGNKRPAPRPPVHNGGGNKHRSTRRYEASPVESSTEGDSSQQSQRSVVYLHAATVGDIPGPDLLRQSSKSPLDVDSTSTRQVKTLGRSFSVLAPWRPRHPSDTQDIDYSRKNGKFEPNSARNGPSRKENTLRKRADSRKTTSGSSSTINRRSRSKENLSHAKSGSSSTLYRKKERLPRENSRYSSDGGGRIAESKSTSVESLSRIRGNKRDVSRSVSMPKDPEKSAGWFKITAGNKNKGHHKSDFGGSSKRL